MTRTCDELIDEIERLRSEDFDMMSSTAKGMERLYKCTEELAELPDAERLVPVLFQFLERFPELDLGSPGPVVHALERMQGRYEEELKRSIERSPTDLTVWMVNRLINGAKNNQQLQEWLQILHDAAASTRALPAVRQSALGYIEFQRRRGRTLI